MTQTQRSWSTTDPDEATDAFAPVYKGVQIASPEEGRFSVTAHEAGDPDLTLNSLDFTARGSCDLADNSFYIVCEFFDADIGIISGGEPLDIEGPVLVPPTSSSTRWEHSYRARTVRIEQSAIDAFAREHFDRPRATVSFTGTSALSARHADYWRAVTTHIRDHVIADPDVFADDLIWSQSRNLIIAAMLATFPNTTMEEEAAGASRALPASVRRAVAYLEANVGEPITLAEVAAAARLSPRGLQDAFRRTLGCSPLQYLRGLRLEGVRGELVAADPAAGETVERIARRWGFVQLPRFAASYREQYGENPSVTLRR